MTLVIMKTNLTSSGGPLHLSTEVTVSIGTSHLYCHLQVSIAVAGDSLDVELAGGQHHRPWLSAPSRA